MKALSTRSEETDGKQNRQSTNSTTRNGLTALTHYTLKQIRRLVVLVTGLTVVLVGVIMVVTPGPALIVIPAGLGILAIEFAWARSLLVKAKSQIEKSLGGTGERRKNKTPNR